MQVRNGVRLRRALIATWFVVVVAGTLAAWAVRVGNEPLGRQALNPHGWAAAYERAYGHLEGVPQPRISRVQMRLDVFPEEERLWSRGSVVVRNETLVGVPELLLTAPERAESIAFRVPGKALAGDEAFPLRRYRLARPLEPGETLRIRFEFDVAAENAGRSRFHATDFLPHVGYDPDLEIRNPRLRRRYGLPLRSEAQRRAPSPEHVHATIGTSSGHTVVAPGKLVRRWREDGRAFFEYQGEPWREGILPSLAHRQAR